MLQPGSIVGGRYQIVRPLGRGGMGEVYEATQVQLARRVALKTIRAELASKPELLARFRREAESAAALGHPNLVQVTDFQALPNEPPFLVMEMLDGSTLSAVLQAEGRVEPARAAFIGVQLLSGLGAAHRAGIVHRDVKPANIFLQSTTAVRDLVKVLDFGVAKLALEAIPGARAMTQAGEILGTLSYMAPEQGISGAAIDARTDIFGVGATLFHALSGLRPFDCTEPGGGRTPLDKVAPWVHRDLAAVIERALQKSPDARWANADEMAAALQPFASGAGASMVSTLPSSGAEPGSAPRMGGGWDPAAIGRLEAPTGGSSFGGASMAGSMAGSIGGSSMGYAPTGYAPGSDPSVPRDGTLLGHGARAPAAHSAPEPFIPAPRAFAPAAAPSMYGAPPAVSGAAPVGAVPYVMRPSGPPMQMPMGASHGQHAYGPPPQHSASGQYMHGLPPKAGKPWWLLAVAVVVLGASAPYVMSFIAIRNATNPETIANNVERQVLLQPKQPCPAPDQCNQSVEEHDLVYPICSRKIPRFSPYKAGEMVVAGSEKRIALVNTDVGGGRYVIRFLTVQQEVTVRDEDIVGRLCKAGPRRESSQTAP